MAYTRGANIRGSWFQEQQNLINSSSTSELGGLSDNFDSKFQDTITKMSNSYNGINVMRDAKRMMDSPEIMLEYKSLLLDPIIDEIRDMAAMQTNPAEKVHLESMAEQLDDAWEASKTSFIQESYNTSTYLPLATLDFPALIKQYIRFLGKDIIPVQTASSTNIEQRIFIKYLVNNQTGEEYETPKIYFQKEEDGTPTWKKLWEAGKGIKIDNIRPVLFTDIAAAVNKRYSIFNHLLDDDGVTAKTMTPGVRDRLSYDFAIPYIQVSTTVTNDDDTPTTETVKVKLPGGGIQIDIQSGGNFIGGDLNVNTELAVVDPATNKPTGATVKIGDRISGRVDFVKGTLTASVCGTEITGLYIQGHISNETNMRTIGFREYPEIRKFLISDGCRFQLPFTVEDFAEANASLNFNLYNRLVQELVTAQEMFEDESILQYLDDEFNKYDGANSDVWALESYVHTEYVDLDPTTISPSFAGDPFEYRTNAIHNAIASTIYELCDKGKLDNLGFVIYANPKAARLINKFVTWTTQKSTEIGGVQMNHAFGVLTDEDIPIRVVSSNRVDAYIEIPAYQAGAAEEDVSREYFFKIVAYPMDKFHVSYKHLRFARHLTNSPENAAYADAQNPGGAAVMVTTSSQYKTINIQGIQGRVICKNTALVPDVKAGIVG